MSHREIIEPEGCLVDPEKIFSILGATLLGETKCARFSDGKALNLNLVSIFGGSTPRTLEKPFHSEAHTSIKARSAALDTA